MEMMLERQQLLNLKIKMEKQQLLNLQLLLLSLMKR
ncbi:hypothetical protein LINGRAHAP2_LOCUS10698 [Linum grandiflorum]